MSKDDKKGYFKGPCVQFWDASANGHISDSRSSRSKTPLKILIRPLVRFTPSVYQAVDAETSVVGNKEEQRLRKDYF